MGCYIQNPNPEAVNPELETALNPEPETLNPVTVTRKCSPTFNRIAHEATLGTESQSKGPDKELIAWRFARV